MTDTYSNLIASVRSTLRALQDGYSARDVTQADTLAGQLIAGGNNSQIVGTGFTEWCRGWQQSRDLLKSDWEHWGDVDYNFGAARIVARDDIAWLASEGTLTYRYDRANLAAQMIERLERYLAQDRPASEKVHTINTWFATEWNEASRGERSGRPLRFSAVLKPLAGRWQFRQMHFSHPTTRLPDLRCEAGSSQAAERSKLLDELAAFQLGRRAPAPLGVRQAMAQLQQACRQGDVALARSLLARDGDVLLIGSGSGQHQGTRAVADVLAAPGAPWGDLPRRQLVLDLNRMVVDREKQYAWLAVSGITSATLPAEQVYQTLLDRLQLFSSDDSSPPESKLFDILQQTAFTLGATAQGETYHWPLRLTALLARDGDAWRFHQLHFSFPNFW